MKIHLVKFNRKLCSGWLQIDNSKDRKNSYSGSIEF